MDMDLNPREPPVEAADRDLGFSRFEV